MTGGRVVITGASGFVGRNVLLRAPREWDIVALYHQATDFPAFLQRHGLSHVRALRADLADPADAQRVGAALGGGGWRGLYLAANSDPTVSARDPAADLRANAGAMVNFLEHCPTEHLVFFSSGAVYDGLVGDVTPASAVDPVLPYAISKLASERYLRFYAAHRGAPASYVIVRFFGAYGPYEPPRKVTTRWLRALASGQREFVVRGDGKNLIDFMYVDDAVDGTLRLLDARDARLTVDFASGAPVTIDALMETMAATLGVSVSVRHDGATAEYVRFRSVDATMRERFGVVPSTPLEKGLQQLRAFLAKP
ncbi:MAG: NAD(P)-dependent oxidoreductase [Candidatus Rokubacteria bacterium]|nr:NAD(P)-dependent oxidoreductase [Candidatus Rokubacteria bacterium]